MTGWQKSLICDLISLKIANTTHWSTLLKLIQRMYVYKFNHDAVVFQVLFDFISTLRLERYSIVRSMIMSYMCKVNLNHLFSSNSFEFELILKFWFASQILAGKIANGKLEFDFANKVDIHSGIFPMNWNCMAFSHMQLSLNGAELVCMRGQYNCGIYFHCWVGLRLHDWKSF